MIKDVMVRLDGTPADDVRLSAAEKIAKVFDGEVIGLFINVLPSPIPDESGVAAVEAIEQVREAGDSIEQELEQRLQKLGRPAELRRCDVFNDTLPAVTAREARSADAFIVLRPGAVPEEPGRVVESVLFGSGRHLLLMPDVPDKAPFDRIMVAWNGSRESARALAEAMPYLEKASEVTIVAVVEEDAEYEAELGKDAVEHLRHHGIDAALRHVSLENNDVAETLLKEARKREVDLIVLGGYGHSRLREWLLGGVTYKLLHQATIPVVMAH